MSEPTAIELAMARAALAVNGQLAIPAWLMSEMVAVTEKMRTHTATKAEVDAVESSLREIPGYDQWVAAQMLAETLRNGCTSKALAQQ